MLYKLLSVALGWFKVALEKRWVLFKYFMQVNNSPNKFAALSIFFLRKNVQSIFS